MNWHERAPKQGQIRPSLPCMHILIFQIILFCGGVLFAYMHVSSSMLYDHWVQKRVTGPLALELETVWANTWVLGAKPQSLEKQQVLLTHEPPLYPRLYIFVKSSIWEAGKMDHPLRAWTAFSKNPGLVPSIYRGQLTRSTWNSSSRGCLLAPIDTPLNIMHTRRGTYNIKIIFQVVF